MEQQDDESLESPQACVEVSADTPSPVASVHSCLAHSLSLGILSAVF